MYYNTEIEVEDIADAISRNIEKGDAERVAGGLRLGGKPHSASEESGIARGGVPKESDNSLGRQPCVMEAP